MRTRSREPIASATPSPSGAPSPSTRTGRGWHRSPERTALLALYAEADALLDGWTCRCTADGAPGQAVDTPCCHFAVTGREPYPTAVELEEIRHAMRAAGVTAQKDRGGRRNGPSAAPSAHGPRRLPLADDDRRACPLLSAAGRCRIYASRPLGCRTYFCHGAEAPFGARSKPPRDEANAIGRRIADLSSRFAPRDPHPRALTKSLGGVLR